MCTAHRYTYYICIYYMWYRVPCCQSNPSNGMGPTDQYLHYLRHFGAPNSCVLQNTHHKPTCSLYALCTSYYTTYTIFTVQYVFNYIYYLQFCCIYSIYRLALFTLYTHFTYTLDLPLYLHFIYIYTLYIHYTYTMYTLYLYTIFTLCTICFNFTL